MILKMGVANRQEEFRLSPDAVKTKARLKCEHLPGFCFYSIVDFINDSSCLLVGMTGFEPATTRPPAVCATGLRHIPIGGAKIIHFADSANAGLFYFTCLERVVRSADLLSHLHPNVYKNRCR